MHHHVGAPALPRRTLERAARHVSAWFQPAASSSKRYAAYRTAIAAVCFCFALSLCPVWPTGCCGCCFGLCCLLSLVRTEHEELDAQVQQAPTTSTALPLLWLWTLPRSLLQLLVIILPVFVASRPTGAPGWWLITHPRSANAPNLHLHRVVPACFNV